MYEVIQTAYRAFDVHSNSISDAGASQSPFGVITVRCREPSAVTFGDVSGVEMTDTRRLETSWVPGEIAAKIDWVSRFDVDHGDL